MKTKLHYLPILLIFLFSATLYSQTNSFELLLKKDRLNEEQAEYLESYLGASNKSNMKQSYQNQTQATGFIIDSVTFVMLDGRRFQECYSYEDGKNIAYYTNLNIEGEWANYERVLTKYDANGNDTSRVSEKWNGTDWIPTEKDVNQYDEDGNNIFYAPFVYDSTGWVQLYKEECEFDDNGNEIHLLRTHNNGRILETIREFNSNNNVIDEVSVLTNADTLVYHHHTTFTYNEDRTFVTEHTQELIDGQWLELSKSTKEIDNNGNILSITSQYWADSVWVNEMRVIYEYDQNTNPILSRMEIWSSLTETWNGLLQVILEYDSNGNLILELMQNSFGGMPWSDRSRTVYEYNNDGIVSTGFCEILQDSSWVPTNGYLGFSDPSGSGDHFYYIAHKIEKVFYSSVTGVSEENNLVKEFSLSQNYPNPFNPTTSIEYQVSRREMVMLKVYDILGNEVATLVNEQKSPGTYKVKFNAADLSSGVYFYTLQAGAFKQSKKLLLLK